jgi:hypothetical protein
MEGTRRHISWGIVAHTIAMFSFVTIYTAITLDLKSVELVDNTERITEPLSVCFGNERGAVANSMVQLNQWLADGLLVS